MNVWRPNHFTNGIDALTNLRSATFSPGSMSTWAFATQMRGFYLGYNITLQGQIVFLSVPKTLFRSDFDPTPDGEPPATVQAVGTARVEGPAGSVIVIDPSLCALH